MRKLYWSVLIAELSFCQTLWTPTPTDHSMYREAAHNFVSNLAQTARNIANEDILTEFIDNPITIGGIISTVGPIARMLFTAITGSDPATATSSISTVPLSTLTSSIGTSPLSTLTSAIGISPLSSLTSGATSTANRGVSITRALPLLSDTLNLVNPGTYTYYVDGYGDLTIDQILDLVNQGVLDRSVLEAAVAASMSGNTTLLGSVIGVSFSNTSPEAIRQLIPSIEIRPPRSVSNTYIPTSGAPYQPSLGLESYDSKYRRSMPRYHAGARHLLVSNDFYLFPVSQMVWSY